MITAGKYWQVSLYTPFWQLLQPQERRPRRKETEHFELMVVSYRSIMERTGRSNFLYNTYIFAEVYSLNIKIIERDIQAVNLL